MPAEMTFDGTFANLSELSAARSTRQTIALSIVYVAVATFVHAGIALLAGTARRLPAVTEHGLAIRRFLAAALAGVAIWLAFATAR